MFPQRLIFLRRKKGFTQYELAEKLGFSRGKLANYEQGTRQPDYATLQDMADFFEVSTDYLLGKRNQPETGGNKDRKEKFTGDSELQDWYYSELPYFEEKEIRQLHQIWKIMKENK